MDLIQTLFTTVYRMLFYERQDFVDFFRKSSKFRDLDQGIGPTSAKSHKFISVCTTCMNRLHDLKETLPQNIEDNIEYPYFEFVLLDYSSRDGLEEWVKSEMMHHIQSGRLVYYKTIRHSHFRSSHPRNVTFRLSRGEIVANVDADNYINKGFLSRINQCSFYANEGIVILPEKFLLPNSNRILLKGRFAMYKKDLFSLGGFDEDLDETGGYSREDIHFIFRAMLSGFKIIRFEDIYNSRRIETLDEDRVKYMVTIGSNFEETKKINEIEIGRKLGRGIKMSNVGRRWGHDILERNFSETVET